MLRHWYLQHKRPRKGHVFGHPDGTAIGSLKKSFTNLVNESAIERETAKGKVTWHSLRHSFGTRLGAQGVDVETLRELMGHADISTTQRYLQTTEEQKRKAVEKMQEALESA